MKSVFEKLENLSNYFENSTFKLLAQQLLQDYFSGNFRSQKELSQICFVSESSITKFAKKIGYSGYREMLFTLKNEFTNYISNKNEEKIDTIEIFNSIQNWIIKNENFVFDFSESIKKISKINIFASYQIQHAVEYIYDLFISLDKNIKIISNDFNSFNTIKDDEITLLILLGRDNETLLKVFEKEYNGNSNNFLISSSKQRHKIKYNFKNELIFDFKFDNSKSIYRNIAIEMIFLYIFEKCN